MAKILLIDDEQAVRDALQSLFLDAGYEVVVAANAADGLAAASDGRFQVVVTDWKLPDLSGLEIIQALRASQPRLPVILITGYHSDEVVIEATKFGAYDYILKMGDPTELLALVGRAVAICGIMSQPVEIGESGRLCKDALLGTSRVMREVYKEIGRVAAKPVTVLIRGEPGTGKDLVARAIYHHSQRVKEPFILVDCRAVPNKLLDSELFGHEPGAFREGRARRIGRFEQANHGTILLDEVGDLPPSTQAALMEALDNNTIRRVGGQRDIAVDVRVIATTERDLERGRPTNDFCEELYHRLAEEVLVLPPLRERREDIPELIRFFIQRGAVEFELSHPHMPTADAMEYLQQQSWPGNVRQLRNVLRKAQMLAGQFPIEREALERALTQAAVPLPAGEEALKSYIAQLLAKAEHGELHNTHSVLLRRVEHELCAQALRLASGDKIKAGAWLGLSPTAMAEKLEKYRLHPQDLALFGDRRS